MLKKVKMGLIAGSTLVASMVIASPVSAAIPTIEFSQEVGFSSLAEAMGTAIEWGIFLALLAAGMFLIWAGFKYVTAGDDSGSAEKARTQMSNAVIGVIIVASVYLILRLIQQIIPGMEDIIKFN